MPVNQGLVGIASLLPPCSISVGLFSEGLATGWDMSHINKKPTKLLSHLARTFRIFV